MRLSSISESAGSFSGKAIGGVLVVLLFFFSGARDLSAAIVTPANPGYTGLWEYPTAEMPGDGEGRLGYTRASPYAFYYADLAWLPWMEINARLTTFDNIYVEPSGALNNTGHGRDYMDKAVDIKVMLHRSRNWYVPSVAFGVTDLMGTELMKAQYGVATWRYKALALSLGYGTDRMNGFFGGISWDATDWLTLKAEYSPMDYTLDAAGGYKPHPGAPDAKYNVGVALRTPSGLEGAFSWQRGEEFALSFSQHIDLRGPYLFGKSGRPGKRGADYEAPGGARVAQWRDVDPAKLGRDIADALARFVKVRDVEVAIAERKVYIAYENYGHASQAEAMVRVLVIAASLSPHLDSLFLVPRMRGVPVVCAEFPGEVLFAVRVRDMETKDPLQASRFLWADENFFASRGETWLFRERSLGNRAQHDFKAMLVYEPRIDQTLDDDYQDRMAVDFLYENRSDSGWAGFVDVKVPIWNDVDIYWEPDMNDDIRLQQAVASYLDNWRMARDPENAKFSSLWSLSEAGWLDENWFGFNQWGRIYSQNGRWWGGARLGIARDRDPTSFAGFAEGRIRYGLNRWRDAANEDPWQTVALVQAGFTIPEMDLDFQVDYGRYADEDVGGKLSVTRRWDDTAVGFWISRTDNLTPGKDFTQAGVHLELPAEKWFGSWFGAPSAHIWEQDVPLLSTWRIDAAREPGAWRTPERLFSQLRPITLKKSVESLLDEYCAFEADETQSPEIQGLTDFIKF